MSESRDVETGPVAGVVVHRGCALMSDRSLDSVVLLVELEQDR